MYRVKKPTSSAHAEPSLPPASSTLFPSFSRSAPTRFFAKNSAILLLQDKTDNWFCEKRKGEIGRERLFSCLRARHTNLQTSIDLEQLINTETERLANKLGKSFLDCEDIVRLTGLGRDNARSLMHNHSFPVVKVGNRQVVSILAFVTWQMREYLEGDNRYGNR